MKRDDLVKDIKVKLERTEATVTDECCIYRVPFHVRKLNEDAYTPAIVSIGPFHKRHPRLQNMERHKLLCCKRYLERTQTTLENWISYIEEEVVPNFRRCYSDILDFSKEELVELILVDSGFILELFWRYYNKEWSGDATFLSKPWLGTHISLDLLLLENQLPFYVLESLYNLSLSSGSESSFSGNHMIPSFLELTFNYFDFYNISNLVSRDISIRHFTDLIRTFHLKHPCARRSHRINEQVTHLPSATELVQAGVRFKVNMESDCLLDLRFSGNVLEIRQLKVEDSTELLFRNMIALEMCHYPYESYIIDYVGVLDFLVNTSRDVEKLVGNEVLVNWLGDTDSGVNMFNDLCKYITVTNCNSDYIKLCQNLNTFCRDPWHKRKAALKRDYCHTPWQTAASIAGIILLLLAFLQSVCSVLQVI